MYRSLAAASDLTAASDVTAMAEAASGRPPPAHSEHGVGRDRRLSWLERTRRSLRQRCRPGKYASKANEHPPKETP